MKRSAIIAFILAFCATTAMALSVPLNGGFEQADLKTASNWQTRGPWRFKGCARMEGRRSAGIRTYDALPGDRLVADSGLLVHSSRTMTLRGHHHGEAGKIAGLELVNQQGVVIESVASDELGATEEWQEFTVSYDPPPPAEGEQQLYVRPYIEVIEKGVRFAVDNITFTGQPGTDPAEKIEVPTLPKPGEDDDGADTEATAPEPEPESGSEPEPQPDPNYPNLVRNARLSGLTAPQFWNTRGPETRTAHQPPSSGQPGSISITPGEGLAAWSTQIPTMDISVPHSVSMEPAYAAVPSKPVRLVVLVLDYSRTKVYHHRVVDIPSDTENVTTVLPSLNHLPVKGVTRLTWLAKEQMDADFSLSNPTVKVDPHIPNIRPLESLAIFPDPTDVGFFMQIPNRTNQTRPFLTHLKTVTPDGIGIAYDKRRMKVAPRAVAYFPYKPTLKEQGRYTLVIRVQNADGSHTYKYSEYPFVVSSIDENREGGNSHIGVRVSGTDDNEIRAAAMAGAGWICMDVEYTDLLASYDFRSRLRDVTNAAYRAKPRGLKVAVRVKMVGEPDKISPDTGREFAKDLTRRLYGGVDRWIIDTPSVADGRLAAGMAATVMDAGREDIPVMVPCGDGYRLFEPGATTPEELVEQFMSEVRQLAPDAGDAGGADRNDIWPGSAVRSESTDTPEDVDTADTEGVEEKNVETDTPPADRAQSPTWVFTANPASDGAAAERMTRQMKQEMDDGAEVVFWKSVNGSALVDGDEYATAAWLKLRRFVRDLSNAEYPDR